MPGLEQRVQEVLNEAASLDVALSAREAVLRAPLVAMAEKVAALQADDAELRAQQDVFEAELLALSRPTRVALPWGRALRVALASSFFLAAAALSSSDTAPRLIAGLAVVTWVAFMSGVLRGE